MKKLLSLLLIVLIVFAVYNRDRIYVRDPLASVTRNGVPETGVQVFINFHNNVLLEHDDNPRYITLLQHGQPVGAPPLVPCIHYIACLTAEVISPVLITSRKAHIESMTDKTVTFLDDQNREAVVTLH